MRDPVSNSDIVADITHVASKLGRRELSRSEYIQHGHFSHYQIYDGGRTWEELCTAAGVSTRKKEYVSDEVYFARLKEAVESLGRYPKTSERKRFGLNFSKRRYPTLRAFIKQAIRLGILRAALEPVSEPLTVEALSDVPFVNDPTNKTASVLQNIEQGRSVPPIPRQTRRGKWKRTGIEGFPYAPQDEVGVVAVFAILCGQGHIGWQILDLNGGKGIDATCYDHKIASEIQVEFKHTLSRGSWNHPIEDIDYVVCWQNRWPDFPKPVIELRALVEKISDATTSPHEVTR